MNESENNELADIVASIYEAAVFTERWPAALSQTREFVGATSSMFSMSYLASGRGEVIAAHNLDAQTVSDWEQRHGISPWTRAALSMQVGEINTWHSIMPLEALRETSLFQELLEPLGIVDMVGIVTARTPLVLGGITFHDSEVFGPRAVRRLQALGPHLVRATAMRNRVAWLSQRAVAFEEGVERLPVALILVGPEGNAIHANARARALLEVEDGLRLEAGRLTFTDREAKKNFDTALMRCAVIGEGPAARLLMPRPSHARPFQVLVSPSVDRSEPYLGTAALVWIHDPEEAAVPSHSALSQLFGLSPAEASMAASLASGATVREYAAKAGVTEGTARTRLKQMLSKTGSHRQADLVRLILSSLPGLL